MLEHLALERSQAMLLLHNSLIERQVNDFRQGGVMFLSVCLSALSLENLWIIFFVKFLDKV